MKEMKPFSAEEYFKEFFSYTERDIEYRPSTGYWKALKLMEGYAQVKAIEERNRILDIIDQYNLYLSDIKEELEQLIKGE